jgi:hypothetical protein
MTEQSTRPGPPRSTEPVTPMYVHIPRALRAAIDARARDEGTTLRAVVIAALQTYLGTTQ